jgi:hypothetical protein
MKYSSGSSTPNPLPSNDENVENHSSRTEATQKRVRIEEGANVAYTPDYNRAPAERAAFSPAVYNGPKDHSPSLPEERSPAVNDRLNSKFAGRTPLAPRHDLANDHSRTKFAGQTPKRVPQQRVQQSPASQAQIPQPSPAAARTSSSSGTPMEMVVITKRTPDPSESSKKRKAVRNKDGNDENEAKKKLAKKSLWGYSSEASDDERDQRDLRGIRMGTFYSFIERETNRKMRSLKRERSEGSG